MLKKLKSKNEGFTIIEVMIVLAIAGLIMLIVFLAVPALQRTSRNTQRKNDASAVASMVSDFLSNNSGSLPQSFAYNNGVLSGCSAADASMGGLITVKACATADNVEQAKIGYYTLGKDFYVDSPNAMAVVAAGTGALSPTNVSTSGLLVLENVSCPTPITAKPTATPNDAAVFYATESGSGPGTLQCVDS